jgi:hypothetical protein
MFREGIAVGIEVVVDIPPGFIGGGRYRKAFELRQRLGPARERNGRVERIDGRAGE